VILLLVVVVGFGALISIIPWCVQRAMLIRWKEIVAMFDRALAHGGSLDTLSRTLKEDSKRAVEMSRAAGEAVVIVKRELELHDARIKALEEHPVIRRVGGNIR
jgi:hypothetical protein